MSTRWKVGKEELRERFPQRRDIVDLREVTQTRKDTKQVILIIMIIGNDDHDDDKAIYDDDDHDFYDDDDDDCSHWPYGKRSRYVVKPHKVDSLHVHYVKRYFSMNQVSIIY